MANKRKPTSDELRLIEFLANKANYKMYSNFREDMYVVPITEDVISPLKIMFDKAPSNMKMNGRLIADCQFLDSDNIPVSAYLLVNDENYIVELDFWKADYTPISTIPPCDQMMDIPSANYIL